MIIVQSNDATLIAFMSRHVPPDPDRCRSKLKIENRTGNVHQYSFTRMGIVLLGTDLVEISLDSEQTPDHKHNLRIVQFCSTHPDPSVVGMAYAYAADGTHIGDLNTGRCTRIGLRVKPGANEMINMGVVVEVTSPSDPAFIDFLLCDPQVGNGPGNFIGVSLLS